METRVAVISIIVEDREAAATLNTVLHDYGDEIIGRMGLPYPKKKINIISVAVDAAPERIQKLQDALTAIPGVKAEAVCSNL
ncbi:MAG: iron-only hydrogenase system regulator [Clostridiales bacterium]|nr:iron-only hydrogenase system regulator [Clostridia bacterium]MCR4882795.1 iron-only hydrogenase system regulator [Clostridiales bacterium]